MKRVYQIYGVVVILFAAFMLKESLAMPYWTKFGPGAGFLPTLYSIVIVLLGAITLLQASFGDSGPLPKGFFPDRAGARRMAAMTLGVMAMILLTETVGFRLMATAFLLFMIPALGRQKPWLIAVIAFGGGFGIYQLFAVMLEIPLPRGILGI